MNYRTVINQQIEELQNQINQLPVPNGYRGLMEQAIKQANGDRQMGVAISVGVVVASFVLSIFTPAIVPAMAAGAGLKGIRYEEIQKFLAIGLRPILDAKHLQDGNNVHAFINIQLNRRNIKFRYVGLPTLRV
jgi:hypothetical protein